MGSDSIYGGKAKSKRCVLRYFLKVATEMAEWTESRRLFQRDRAQEWKALAPILVLIVGPYKLFSLFWSQWTGRNRCSQHGMKINRLFREWREEVRGGGDSHPSSMQLSGGRICHYDLVISWRFPGKLWRIPCEFIAWQLWQLNEILLCCSFLTSSGLFSVWWKYDAPRYGSSWDGPSTTTNRTTFRRASRNVSTN